MQPVVEIKCKILISFTEKFSIFKKKSQLPIGRKEILQNPPIYQRYKRNRWNFVSRLLKEIIKFDNQPSKKLRYSATQSQEKATKFVNQISSKSPLNCR